MGNRISDHLRSVLLTCSWIRVRGRSRSVLRIVYKKSQQNGRPCLSGLNIDLSTTTRRP